MARDEWGDRTTGRVWQPSTAPPPPVMEQWRWKLAGMEDRRGRTRDGRMKQINGLTGPPVGPDSVSAEAPASGERNQTGSPFFIQLKDGAEGWEDGAASDAGRSDG